ncbi:MAG: PorT family protein [Prevotella sp.]|nr:PorT family protein [Prevotella sp.]
MKEHDWTEQLRRRLDSYEAPVPDGLWPAIERRMRRRARIVLMRRWAIAAAAVAACVIVVTMMVPRQASSLHEQNLAEIQAETSPLPASPLVGEDIALAAEDGSSSAVKIKVEQPVAVPANVPDTMPIGAFPADNAVKETSVVASATVPDSEPTVSLPLEETGTGTFLSGLAGKVTLPSFSLHVSGLTAMNGISQTDPFLMSPMYASQGQTAMSRTAFLTDYEEESRHDMPFTLGLSMRFPLGSRWWLSTGVDYTRLASTFKRRFGSKVQTTRQRLHYVGVPLSVGYSLWENRHFRCYVSAGVEAMVNVQANVSQGSISRDRVQFAAQASAGAEYVFMRNFSLYLQPGLSYYPDNGSSLENIFKQKPLQPDLQLGLRYTLP